MMQQGSQAKSDLMDFSVVQDSYTNVSQLKMLLPLIHFHIICILTAAIESGKSTVLKRVVG